MWSPRFWLRLISEASAWRWIVKCVCLLSCRESSRKIDFMNTMRSVHTAFLMQHLCWLPGNVTVSGAGLAAPCFFLTKIESNGGSAVTQWKCHIIFWSSTTSDPVTFLLISPWGWYCGFILEWWCRLTSPSCNWAGPSNQTTQSSRGWLRNAGWLSHFLATVSLLWSTAAA